MLMPTTGIVLLGRRRVSGGGSPPTALTLVDGANASSATCSLPTGSAAGDLAIFASAATNSSGVPTDVTPTDWVNMINFDDGSKRRRKLMAGVLTAADIIAGSITGPDGTSNIRSVMATFTPDQPITNIDYYDTNEQFTAGNPAAQVVNASGGSAPLIVASIYSAGNVINPRTWSPGTGTEYNNGSRCYLKFEIFNSSPADTTIDMDDEGGANFLGSCWLEVS